MELQAEVEAQKWRATLLEAEKLQRQLDFRDLQAQVERLREAASQGERENARVTAELKRVNEEMRTSGAEVVAKAERERDQIREMLQRVQLEKDRIVEQNRERLSDYEARLKKLEQDRQR